MLKISIPDMSCEHCRKTLETLLSRMKGVASCDVDLDLKTIVIEGDAEWKEIEAAIQDAGYSPEKLTN